MEKEMIYRQLDCFDIEDIINYLKSSDYKIIDEDQITETIETDIRGAEIKANGETYQFSGCVKIIVGRD